MQKILYAVHKMEMHMASQNSYAHKVSRIFLSSSEATNELEGQNIHVRPEAIERPFVLNATLKLSC